MQASLAAMDVKGTTENVLDHQVSSKHQPLMISRHKLVPSILAAVQDGSLSTVHAALVVIVHLSVACQEKCL